MASDELIRREQDFYNQRWGHSDLSDNEKNRITYTVAAIPDDCRRVLDVGCGDGRLSHEVKQKLDCFLVALDLSTVALARLTVPKCCGSAGQLPFADRSFDMVMATEILEHLPIALYPLVLSELARVARRYLLITVPNSENLEEHMAVCPACGARFHAWGHLRSYTNTQLKSLFRGFILARSSTFGADVEIYNRLLLFFRSKVARGCYWEDRTTCYFCHSSDRPVPRSPFLVRVCDSLNLRFWTPIFRQPAWLLGLFRRNES